jgi:sugar phosphate isomerase/epimerase
MKLGIGSYTFPWAIGLPGALPAKPLRALDLMEKAQELGVGLVQFGPNLPLDKLPEKDLKELVKRADSWKIDLEIGTVGFDLERLRFQIEFARRIGAIVIKTSPERPDGTLPTLMEISEPLRRIADDLARAEIGLALDNSRMPAPELNELLGAIRSPWLGAALDTANPLGIPQGWQISLRVLGHRALSLHIKDFVVQPDDRGMGFTIKGAPVGTGQLNIAWMMESIAAIRVEPSVILESWTPEQATLDETLKLENDWAIQGVEFLRKFIAD